MADASS